MGVDKSKQIEIGWNTIYKISVNSKSKPVLWSQPPFSTVAAEILHFQHIDCGDEKQAKKRRHRVSGLEVGIVNVMETNVD